MIRKRRPMRPCPTAAEVDILEMLERYMEERGYAPSMREIQDACGVASLSTVMSRLRRLRRAGYIVQDAKVARSVRLTGKGWG